MQLDESVKKPEKDCCCRQAGLVIAPFRPRGYHSEPLHRGKPGTLGLDCSQIGRRTRGRWSVRVGLKTQRLNDWSPGYFGAVPKRLKRSRLRSGANWAQISTMQCQRHKRASTGESSNRNKEVQATLMPQQRYRDFSHGAPGHAPGSPLAPLLVICERGGGCKSRGPEEKPTTHRTTRDKKSVLEHPSPPPKRHPLLALRHSSTVPPLYHSTVFAQFLKPRLCSWYPGSLPHALLQSRVMIANSSSSANDR